MGPGRLLHEVHKTCPNLDLFGLDISRAMVRLARERLGAVARIDLRAGNIVQTDYASGMFDCIVTTGSFYDWSQPVDALNEMHRVLGRGRKAFVFEWYRDHDELVVSRRLNESLRPYDFVRRKLSKYYLSQRLSMTYTIAEIEQICARSAFRTSYEVERVELGRLPVYARVHLTKG